MKQRSSLDRRPFRLLHGLRDNGQAWGSTLTWVGLVVFSAASPISIAATNIAWGVALAGLLVQALSRDDRFASLVRRTDLDVPLTCFVLSASLLAVSTPWTSNRASLSPGPWA